MDLYENLSEIFDEPVDASTNIRELDNYGSLIILSITAMLEANYGIYIESHEIRKITYANELETYIKNNGK